MERRFFCTVFAEDRRHLAGLNNLEVDIFPSTAQAPDEKQAVIDGLLTLEQIAALVDKGYRVLVEDDISKRTRAAENVITAEAWIKAFEARR